MPRCKARCSDGTKCLFDAQIGNYGFCGHHRGRKESKKSKVQSKPKRVPFKCSADGCRPSAAYWAEFGMKLGTQVEYNGKVREMKMDINGRKFWGAPTM